MDQKLAANSKKEEQLKKIQEQQAAVTKILNEVGYLEANKHGLLHELAGVNEGIEEFTPEKFVKGLFECKKNVQETKQFGAIHGFYGVAIRMR